MRDGWAAVTLRDVCRLHYGKALPASERHEGAVPVAGSSGRFDWHDDANTGAGPSVVIGRKGTAGSVTWFNTPAWVTDTAYWAEPLDGMGIHCLRLVLEAADLPSHTAQTGVPGLNRDRAYSVPVAIPPLDEQQRIVDLIAAADDAIEAAEAETAASSAQMRSLRALLVTDRAGTPRPLKDFIDFAGGHAFPPNFQGRSAGEIPFVKVSDMNLPGNEVVISVATNSITESDRIQLRARAWPQGTVIFPKVGAALMTEKRRILGTSAIFDNNVMGLVALHGLLPRYLLLYMEGVELGRLAQQGAVPSINQSHVGNLPIVLPDLTEQERVIALCDGARAAAEAAESTVQTLRVLRSNLLTALLSGEHVIPSSYDRFLEEAA